LGANHRDTQPVRRSKMSGKNKITWGFAPG
jgi:hypothetical protein